MEIQLAFEIFLEECSNGTLKRRSKATLDNYRISMNLLLRWFPVSNMRELDESLFRQFFRRGEMVGNKGRKWKASTVVSHRKNLSPFLDWATKKGYLEKNPLAELPTPPIPDRIPEIYSQAEIEKMLYVTSTYAYTSFEKVRNTAILATFLMTGLRKGELLGLRVRDVDFENQVVRVRSETAKNRHARAIPMTHRLQNALEDYWKAREKRDTKVLSFWISSTRDQKFTTHGLKHLFDKVTKEVEFKVRAHKFRHTFATRFYQGSRDLASLQQLLGHRKITTTMIYTRVLPENTRNSLEKNPLNHLF